MAKLYLRSLDKYKKHLYNKPAKLLWSELVGNGKFWSQLVMIMKGRLVRGA